MERKKEGFRQEERREVFYSFGEVVEIDGGEAEKIVAAESSNSRHLP